MHKLKWLGSIESDASNHLELFHSVETTSRVNRLIDYLGNNRLSKVVIDYRKIIDY